MSEAKNLIMSVFVIGAGRSGTNLVLEILTGSSCLKASKEIENKKLFLLPKKYKNDYLTKCDTLYIKSNQIEKFIKLNPDGKFILTLRDPRDMILSKIYNGNLVKPPAADVVPEVCIQDLKHMDLIFDLVRSRTNVYMIRLEDLLWSIGPEIERLCLFLKIPFKEKMLYFYKRMRNLKKRERYSGLELDQRYMYKRISEIYGGFFVKNKYPLDWMFSEVEYLIDKYYV